MHSILSHVKCVAETKQRSLVQRRVPSMHVKTFMGFASTRIYIVENAIRDRVVVARVKGRAHDFERCNVTQTNPG